MKVTLISDGEPHYQIGLVTGLSQQPLDLEVVGGGSALSSGAIMTQPRVRSRNLRQDVDPKKSKWINLLRVIRYYARLMGYAVTTDSRLLHIQWPYKFPFFDRTFLNVFFKIFRRKLVFTAHNVDQEMRDGHPSWRNQASLRFLYRIVDHVIVHTSRMKEELSARFSVEPSKITVIPHGINIAVPETGITRDEARASLGLKPHGRVLLFFGLIDRYKGIEFLVDAVGRLSREGEEIQVIIAGRIKECQEYWAQIDGQIRAAGLDERIVRHLKRIPDESLEIYFKASDALVMPYRSIFQSGVLFLAYRFGLPVVASDVGSLREDIIEGRTGFLFRPQDPVDLSRALKVYFASELYNDLEEKRAAIRDYAFEKYSWSKIGALTFQVYKSVLGAPQDRCAGAARLSDVNPGKL